MKPFVFIFTLLVLWQCSPTQVQEQLSVPAGTSVLSVTTTSLDWQNKPVNDVAYVPLFLDNFVIHNTFTGLTDGQHYYHVVITNADGIAVCQDSPAMFESKGGTHESWTKINAPGCLTEPGEYTLKVYLDHQWVMAKKVSRLSQEETTSGRFDPYWNKGKYVEVFPPAGSTPGAEWKVKTLATFTGEVSNLFVTTHNGFNRIFYVEGNAESPAFSLLEYQEYGPEYLFEFPNGEGSNPKSVRFWVESGKLYFYNNEVHGSYNLNSGDKLENDPLPFTPAPDFGFDAPSREHWLTRKAIVDDKRSLVSSDQYCNDPEILWASWNDTSSRLYYWIGCGQGSDYGFFTRDLNKGKAQRLLEDFQGVRYPFYFQNNGVDFIAFIEQEEGDEARLKIATQASYPEEFGFGTNFRWARSFNFPASAVDRNNAWLNVDFHKPPRDFLSYRFSDGYANQMFGEVTSIGRIRDGDWSGLELFRMFDAGDTQGDKSMGINPTIEYTYLVRSQDNLFVINGRDSESGTMKLADPDGKRMKSHLFNGVNSVTYCRNLYISGLLGPASLDIPDSDVKLKRHGIVKEMDDPNFRKLFDHVTEGAILVKQKDDGSFWRINGDQTMTLYGYQYDFDGITVNGSQMKVTEYVPFTNLDCLGEPLDMAHILTPDPSRLVEIGKTSSNTAVFGFASAEDEVLKKEYEDLKTSYENSGEQFKNLEEFMNTIPLFLWKDPFGRYVRFIRKEHLAPSNCEPILYLYPETMTDVKVELGEKIRVISSNPPLQSAWQLTANSDGMLVDRATSRTYDHIFWEGISGHLPPLQEGFVVDTAELKSFLDEKLYCLGLNEKETRDFQSAWLKEFCDAPYYFIGFYDRDVIDNYAPMKVTPSPATVIRILMDYRPLWERVEIESPVFGPRPEREGFTIVEWAGLKRASSSMSEL